MKTIKSRVDLRPFQSKAERRRQDALQAQYHELAIPELIAALGLDRQEWKKDRKEERAERTATAADST